MAQYTIGISIEADDNATSQINKAESSLLDLEKSQQGVTTGANAATDAANKQKSAFGDLAGQVGGLVAGYLSLKGVQLVGEMIEQGQAVNTAAATFRNLSGGALEADGNLRMMRESTGGIVSDFTLMSGANRLLLMNLAETGDEASKLTQIAVTLGRAMGQDAGESVEAFAALLANQSIPRLDNFGISSDRVRQRLEELKAAGMGAQEAFSQAVMEQGALALDRLGSATTAAITPVEQLKTTWTNFWDNFDSRLAQGVNGLIGLAQYATGTTAPQQALSASALDNLTPIYQSMMQGVTGGANNDYLLQFIRQTLQTVAADPSLASDAAALGDKVKNDLLGQGIVAHKDFADALTGVYKDIPINQVFTMLAGNVLQVNEGLRVSGVEADNARAKMEGMKNALVMGTQTTPGVNPLVGFFGSGSPSGTDAMSAQLEQAGSLDAQIYWGSYTQFWRTEQQRQEAEEAQIVADRINSIMEASAAAQSQLGGFMSEGAGIGDYAFQEQADAMAAKFEEIKALGEQGLISQDDVEKASDLNDQVQDAAEAMKNLKLPDVFGQGTGGIQGQITDDLIAQMQASGNFKPEDIEAMKKQLDLQSGRETSASVAYQEDILPLLGDIGKLSPDDMAKAVANLSSFMELAAQKGLTPDQIATMMPMATGYGHTGQGANPFTVQPGQTPGEIAAMLGVPVEQVLGMTGAANAGMMMPGQYMGGQGVAPIQGFSLESMFGGAGAEGGGVEGMNETFLGLSTSLQDMVQPTQEITDSFTILNSSAATITSNVGQLGADLALLAAGTHKIDVELNITNLDFINSLMRGQGGGGGSTVRDNGGTVAGMDARTQ